MMIPYLACMAVVAAWNRLPPRVLPSIQAVEGGRIGSVHGNADGSQDLGVMQINTRWVQPLAQYTGQPDSVIRDRLIGDPCFNIAAAGAIMAAYLAEEHGDLMRAVGDYHSHTPTLNAGYQQAVMAAARVLFQSSR